MADDCGLDRIRDRAVETASTAEIKRIADTAWRVLAEGLEARSPFYAAKFRSGDVTASDVSTVSDLHRLPTTTKDEIRARQEQAPSFGDHVGVDPVRIKRVYQTSGSSGKPYLIDLTPADAEIWTTIGARTYWATGVHPHNSVLTVFGAGPFVAGHTHYTFDRIGARRVPVGPGDTARVLSAMTAGLVDTLLATPSFALHLAALTEERGIEGPTLGVRHVAVGGEPGGGIPDIRGRIESVFGADVTEAGGIGEISPSLWGECREKEGMHFCGQGLVWPEMIDPDTEEPIAIEPGAIGEMVYTTLVRESMPLVRFRSLDIAEVQDDGCPCGRTSFRMRVVGRTDNMFIVRGVNVFPSAAQAVVAEFQPAVTGRSRIVLGPGEDVSVEPPVRVEVEVPQKAEPSGSLVAEIESAIRAPLIFRASVSLLRETSFGDPGYKTKPLTRR